jgi:hypothetical protein
MGTIYKGYNSIVSTDDISEGPSMDHNANTMFKCPVRHVASPDPETTASSAAPSKTTSPSPAISPLSVSSSLSQLAVPMVVRNHYLQSNPSQYLRPWKLLLALLRHQLNPQHPLIILLEKTRIVGRGKVSQSQTTLFKLIPMNCFLF